jgi:hypothetical protein
MRGEQPTAYALMEVHAWRQLLGYIHKGMGLQLRTNDFQGELEAVEKYFSRELRHSSRQSFEAAVLVMIICSYQGIKFEPEEGKIEVE